MANSLYDSSLLNARNACTPSAVLRQIYEAIEIEEKRYYAAPENFVILKESLARNPNTPLDILKNLAGDFPQAFCQNPIAPLLSLESPTFVTDLPTPDQFSLLRCDAPASLIYPLTQPMQCEKNADVWEEARQHIAIAGELEAAHWEKTLRETCREFCTRPNATQKEKQLFSDYMDLGLLPHWPTAFVPPHGPNDSDLDASLCGDQGRPLAQVLVPDAVPDAARKLAERQDELINLAFALHPDTPTDVLKLIMNGTHLDAPRRRFFVAFHPKVNTDILMNLAGDRNPIIRRVARKHPAMADNAKLTARITNASYRAAIEKNGDSPLWYLVSGLQGKLKADEIVKRIGSNLWQGRLSAVFALAAREDSTERRKYLTLLTQDTNRFVRAAAKTYLIDPTYRFSW